MSVASDDVADMSQNGDGSHIDKILLKKEYHPSNKDGHYIVNAVTGKRYPWKVGSFESNRLYKVTDATGFMDKHGYRLQKNDEPNYEPNFLYYDSPEQASKHLKLKHDAKRAIDWHNKYELMFPNGKFNIEAVKQLSQ